MEIIRCLRCNHVLRNKESIKRQYGKTCFRIIQMEQKPKENSDITFLKMEIKTLKRQIKELRLNGISQITPIERIKQEKTVISNENMAKFGNVISELKTIFTDNFCYKDYLKPEVRENIELPPNLYI